MLCFFVYLLFTEISDIKKYYYLCTMDDKMEIIIAPSGLTKKQQFFCKEYIIDFNASRAALAAGYSKKTAGKIGSENLGKLEISKYLQYLTSDRSKRLQVSSDKVVQELAKIAFHNVKDLLDYFDGQVLFNDLDKMDFPEIIKSITVREVLRNGYRIGQIVKIEVYDKIKALELLGKHTAAFTENLNLTNNGGSFEAPKQQVNIIINHRGKEEPLT